MAGGGASEVGSSGVCGVWLAFVADGCGSPGALARFEPCTRRFAGVTAVECHAITAKGRDRRKSLHVFPAGSTVARTGSTFEAFASQTFPMCQTINQTPNMLAGDGPILVLCILPDCAQPGPDEHNDV